MPWSREPEVDAGQSGWIKHYTHSPATDLWKRRKASQDKIWRCFGCAGHESDSCLSWILKGSTFFWDSVTCAQPSTSHEGAFTDEFPFKITECLSLLREFVERAKTKHMLWYELCFHSSSMTLSLHIIVFHLCCFVCIYLSVFTSFYFIEKFSPCSPGWPGTLFYNPPASAFQVWGLYVLP